MARAKALVQRMAGMFSVSVIIMERPRAEDPKSGIDEFLPACTRVPSNSAKTALDFAECTQPAAWQRDTWCR